MAEQTACRVIAIDGPAASGKSTVAHVLANRLGVPLVDSGSMYRAVTLLALERGVSPVDGEALASLAEEVRRDFATTPPDEGPPHVLLAGRDITSEIRSPEVGEAVSPVSTVPTVRHEMVALQRELVGDGPAVVEGRDIGTVVFPDAPLKVFLEATAPERTRRRYDELRDRGVAVTEGAVSDEIEKRDRIDSSREMSPLTRAPDALLIDTMGKPVGVVVDEIVEEYRRRCP